MENVNGIVPTLPVGGNSMGFGRDGMWALLIFAEKLYCYYKNIVR